MEFHETKGGNQFYYGTMPRIAKALERVADQLEKNTAPIVQLSQKGEFTAQMIEIFEDFLDEKGIKIENPEKEDEFSSNIYGCDYGNLQSQIEHMMIRWELMEND